MSELTTPKVLINEPKKKIKLSYQQEDKKQECLHRIDFLYYRLQLKFQNNHQILASLTDIVDYARDMLTWVHEYDYKPNIPGNGYRSLIRLTINMMKYGLSNDADEEDEYFKLVEVFKEAINIVHTLRIDSVKQQTMSTNDHPSFYTQPIAMNVDLMTKFVSNDNLFQLVFGKLENFDKRPLVKYLSKVIHYFMSITTADSWTSALMSMTSITSSSSLTSLTAKRYANHNVNQVAAMLSQGRGYFYENILNLCCNFGNYPNVIKTIHVVRQCKWLISVDMSKDEKIQIKYQNNSSTKGSVRCKVYQQLEKDEKPDGKVVIFTHGGGFITNSPESHEMWLLRFVNSLPRVTFISIDFTVSPGGKFPEALQQILDVILWSQNGNSGNVSSLIDAIGFIPDPKDIIFCGDSSGALLITTALVAMAEINEKISRMKEDAKLDANITSKQEQKIDANASDDEKINKAKDEKQLILPRSLITFYPTFSLTPRVFPSYLLSVFDAVLFPTISVQMASAYLPPMTNGDGSIKWDTAKDDKPWFKYPKDDIIGVFENNLTIFEHPLVSPLFYQKMENLEKVRLYMVALHPDPLLDNAVVMARKWKGPISLDILDDLSHGFLNYIFLIS